MENQTLKPKDNFCACGEKFYSPRQLAKHVQKSHGRKDWTADKPVEFFKSPRVVWVPPRINNVVYNQRMAELTGISLAYAEGKIDLHTLLEMELSL